MGGSVGGMSGAVNQMGNSSGGKSSGLGSQGTQNSPYGQQGYTPQLNQSPYQAPQQFGFQPQYQPGAGMGGFGGKSSGMGQMGMMNSLYGRQGFNPQQGRGPIAQQLRQSMALGYSGPPQQGTPNPIDPMGNLSKADLFNASGAMGNMGMNAPFQQRGFGPGVNNFGMPQQGRGPIAQQPGQMGMMYGYGGGPEGQMQNGMGGLAGLAQMLQGQGRFNSDPYNAMQAQPQAFFNEGGKVDE